MARVFVDTNLWVYPLDAREPEKSRLVTAWLRGLVAVHDVVVSTQVMIELRSVLTHKLQPALPVVEVGSALEALAAFDVVSANANMVLDAHELAVAEQLAWFDALIIEAAIRSHCSVLYSEDFTHGRRLGGSLCMENPFLALQPR